MSPLLHSTPHSPIGGQRLLLVDDDPQIRRMGRHILAAEGHQLELAGSRDEALRAAAGSHFALAICDVYLGADCGIELAAQLRKLQPHLAILMVSGDDDPQVALRAAERGHALSYLVKPFTANELRINVANLLLQRQLELDADAHQEQLERAVEERTRELRQAIRELLVSREATIRHLARAVEMRDPNTHAHIDRIGETSALLARALGWPEAHAQLLRIAAPIHDVGKIGIPDRILLKPGPLTPAERAEMERHTTIGYRILAGSDSPLLRLAAVIALTHHERYDGTGYPNQLKGKEIPVAGRIVAVADVYDALVHDRVYRPALPLAEARRIMLEGRGTQFDPCVLDALLEHVDEVNALSAGALEPAPPLEPALALESALALSS